MVRTVNDGAGFIRALEESATKGISMIKIDSDQEILPLPSPAKMPKRLKALSHQLIIDGQGHSMSASTVMAYMIGRDMPVDATEANDIMQSQSFKIENLFLDGKGKADTGILQRASFHDEITHVEVASTLRDGIVLEFGMNSKIDQCQTRNIPRYGFSLRHIEGLGLNKSGSNGFNVIASRSFPREGQLACFHTSATGRQSFLGNFVDHHNGEQPMYGVLVNNAGSTTAKNIVIQGLWAESELQEGGAMILLGLNGGKALVEDVYPQKAGILIEAQGGNYGEINVGEFGYIPGTARFKGPQNGVLWNFYNQPTSFDFISPANWIGGVVPTKIISQGFVNKSKSWGWRGSHPQYNDSRIVTQTMMDTALAGYVKKS